MLVLTETFHFMTHIALKLSPPVTIFNYVLCGLRKTSLCSHLCILYILFVAGFSLADKEKKKDHNKLTLKDN